LDPINKLPIGFNTLAEEKKEEIPLCVPHITGEDWHYIKECLDSGSVSSIGPYVDEFEKKVSTYTGSKYAIAAINGTAALHMSLLIAGVQPNDEVLISALSFIAPANAIRYVGAWPVFIDAEPNYWQIDPEKVEHFLKNHCCWREHALYNKKTGRKVKAILPVHIFGHPVDLDPILSLAKKYHLLVIEDAAECFGAKYKEKIVGTLGDIGCFSFNGNKIVTAGGGGMIVTDNSEWARKAKYLMTQAKDDSVEGIHHEIGYNYRLTALQAALGCSQMERLSDYIGIKRQIADIYTAAFEDMPGVQTMKEADWAFSIFWMFTILVNEKKYGMNRKELSRKLQEIGIQTRSLWQPLHLSSCFKGASSSDCTIAEKLNREGLSLPCSVGLLNHGMSSIEAVIYEVKKNAL